MSEFLALLQELDRVSESRGYPASELLLPGQSRSAVQDQLGGLGVPIPEDVVDWFSWHDGKVPLRAAWVGLSGFQPFSLSEAIDDFARKPEIRAHLAPILGLELADIWTSTRLGVGWNNTGGTLDVELAGAGDHGGPLYAMWSDTADSYTIPAAPSLREAVVLWLQVIEVGEAFWNPARHCWAIRVEAGIPGDEAAGWILDFE